MRRAVAAALVVATLAPGAARAKDTGASKRCIAAAESGQHLRASGKLIGAKKELGACTAVDCPTIIRRDCAKWVEELDEQIPTVVVRVVDGAGKEIVDGRVLVDGELLTEVLDGRAIPVDPGRHRLTWRGAGDARIEAEVVVREGERGRPVLLQAPPKPTPPPTSGPTDASPPVVSLALGGVGVAALGSSALFWGLGVSERSNLAATCAPAHACSDSDVSRARSKLIVGDVLAGVGLLAVGAAVWFWLRRDDAPQPPRAALVF